MEIYVFVKIKLSNMWIVKNGMLLTFIKKCYKICIFDNNH